MFVSFQFALPHIVGAILTLTTQPLITQQPFALLKKIVVQMLVTPIEKDKLYNLAIAANARSLYDFCRKFSNGFCQLAF
ncbi:MAG: hypothetical protein LBU29_02035, partial [Endomicrobium sp.]|nr:hypothetical protein [Endomicrobium sp.]